MDVNEHERISNFTLGYKFKKKRKNIAFMAVLHFTVTVGPSKMTIVPLNEYEMYSVERYSVSLSSE